MKYLYEVRREQEYVWDGKPSKYSVVRITREANFKPLPREILAQGLEFDAAVGYCKLLKEED